jgi:very-short-patch-repair endonuclease
MPLRSRAKKEKFDRARQMRRYPTPAERLLWAEMGKRPYGLRFRRQEVILGWIADFYCSSKKLIIEVDGGYHNEPLQQARDIRRDHIMKMHGLSTIRFANREVLSDVDTVLERIFLLPNKRRRAPRTAA